jgi:hypothetical protein
LAGVEVANLFSLPVHDLESVSVNGQDRLHWLVARDRLQEVISTCEQILVGWGVSEPTGQARIHFREQRAWVIQRLIEHGHDHVWLVGDGPRHPSRWHQFVSRKNRVVVGATVNDRIATALEWRRADGLT